MTEKQKFLAMKAIANNTRITTTEDGRWLCAMTGAGVHRGAVTSSIGGVADDSNEAINACWDAATALKPDEYVVIDGMREGQRAYRWNGFMWAPVDEGAWAPVQVPRRAK